MDLNKSAIKIELGAKIESDFENVICSNQAWICQANETGERWQYLLDQNDDIWRRLNLHLLLRVYLSYILIERSKWNLI